MLFKGKKQIGPEQGIYVNNTQIIKTDQVKFLGVIITDSLNWQSHIDYISKKFQNQLAYIV